MKRETPTYYKRQQKEVNNIRKEIKQRKEILNYKLNNLINPQETDKRYINIIKVLFENKIKNMEKFNE